MSSTRHAKPGTPPKQWRFASAYQAGLLANLVALRVARADLACRAAIWFLQWLSWQPGGVAAQFGAALEKELFELCLNPNFDSPALLKMVQDFRAAWIQKQGTGAETNVGRRVTEALDYARETRSMVLVDGVARIGKTFSARDYCQRRGGLARYVQVPYSNDDLTFFRALARALGISSSLTLKLLHIRARIEEVLQGGDLLLVLDEAAWLWPQTGRNYSLPARVNWLTTALVNFGVPVALITTPQFHTSQRRTERQTGWTSEQFIGRIGYIERLPEVLPIQDLLAVARAIFPEGNERAWQMLAGYADLNTQTKLAGIDALAKRARWLAGQQGRAQATPDDLFRAMRESAAPAAPATPARKAADPRASRPARQPRAAKPPQFRDNGAGLMQASDEVISAWREGAVPVPAD